MRGSESILGEYVILSEVEGSAPPASSTRGSESILGEYVILSEVEGTIKQLLRRAREEASPS